MQVHELFSGTIHTILADPSRVQSRTGQRQVARPEDSSRGRTSKLGEPTGRGVAREASGAPLPVHTATSGE